MLSSKARLAGSRQPAQCASPHLPHHFILNHNPGILELPGPRVTEDCAFDCPANDAAFKQRVGQFQRNILCFWHAADGVDDHADAAGTKKEESAIGDAGEHDHCQFGDAEIDKPLSHQSGRHNQ